MNNFDLDYKQNIGYGSTGDNIEGAAKLQREYISFTRSTSTFTPPVGKKATEKIKYYGGVPLMYDDATDKVYVDNTDTHTLVFGATGSLKSRAVVMPTIHILGYAGESMIINDAKGELYNKLAYELKNKFGYNLVVINLRNPNVSNAWNPLKIPYEFYLKNDMDKAAEFANDIANNLMLAEIGEKDPFWDFSACDLFLGLELLLFKYCKEYNQPIETVNIANIIKLRQTIFANNSPEDNSLWEYAKTDEFIATCLSGTIFAPTNTRNSILSVFDQKIRTFSLQPSLLDMLSDNDFNLEDITNKKMAIFLITPDEKTLFHRLVALFIKQSYEYIIYCAQKNLDNKVKNRINFILDEYSSLPYIHDMSSMISAARSRDIRFLLVIQSKKQLIQRYKEEADTIISNCSNWIFFTSRETELLKEISTLCGEKQRGGATGKPLFSVFDLQHFSKEKREALVLAGRLKPFKKPLLDIDKYGISDKILPFEELPRKSRIKLEFKIPSLEDETLEKRRQYLEKRKQELIKRIQEENTGDNISSQSDTD